MELSLTGRLRQSTQPSPAAKAGKQATAGERPASPRSLPWSDQVTVSKDALAYLKEQARRTQELARRQAEKQNGSEEESELDALAKTMKKMKKCQEIAARIMRGDKVPPEDEAYLMQNDVTGYKLALAMRTPKKDPKEWDSLLDEEDKQGGGSGEAESAETAPTGETGGSASGGEA